MPLPRKQASARRPGFIAGAAVLAVLVVAGVVVSIASITDTHPRTIPDAAAAAPAASGGSVCGLTGMDAAGATLTTAPPTRWTAVGTMAAPSSSTAGPGVKMTDGLRSCYAHTVTGAVFAVANFWATGSDPRLYRQIIQTNVATGPGQTAALNQTGTPANTGMSAQIAAIQVRAYQPAAATVDVALQTSTGEQVSFPVPVVWQNGDWKVQLADDGSPVFRPAILQTLAGYIPWSGTE